MALTTEQAGKDGRIETTQLAVEPPLGSVLTSLSGTGRAGGEPPTAGVRSSESIVGAGLSIEGKLEGTGSVRVAGRFKGTVNVNGDVRVEPGAAIEGDVKADSIIVGGEVRGQVTCRSRVELSESGSLIGDVKAGSLTVAAGSKMRGNVEFG